MEKTSSLLAQHTFFWLLCPWCLGARCISQANLFSFPNSSSSCNTWLGKVNLLLINIFPTQDHCLPRIPLYVKLIYENIAGLRMNHFITFQTKPWVRKEPEGEASHFLSGISRDVCKPCCLECPKILKGCPKTCRAWQCHQLEAPRLVPQAPEAGFMWFGSWHHFEIATPDTVSKHLPSQPATAVNMVICWIHEISSKRLKIKFVMIYCTPTKLKKKP